MTDILTLHMLRHRLSRISYICNLQQESALIIPLGAIAETTFESARIMGLIARTELINNETRYIGQLMRQNLSNPFDFLKKEFEWAWNNTESGEALNVLAGKHTDSLFFSSPTLYEDRYLSAANEAAEKYAVKTSCHKRDQEFLQLLMDSWEVPKAIPPREEVTLTLLAA
jgi:hypothetical protein